MMKLNLEESNTKKNSLSNWVIKELTENVEKNSFFWNMLGSMSYAISTPLLLMVITRFMGNDNAGIFSIAFSISQLFLIVGNYEIRPIQATDVNRKYTLQSYFFQRIFTVSIMSLIGIVYCIFGQGNTVKKILILLLLVYRITDCMGDVIEGEFQRNNRMYVSGKLLFVRTIIPNTFIILAAAIKCGLIFSTFIYVLAAVMIMLWEIAVCVLNINRIDKSSICDIKKIFKEGFPIFIISFLQVFMTNLPKYCIDMYIYNYSIQLVYNVLFMPVLVVNLISGFIIKPYLTDLAKEKESNILQFKKSIIKFTLYIVTLTIICACGSCTLGVSVLELIYGKLELTIYRKEMFILMLGGGASALCIFYYYIIIIINKRNVLLSVYALMTIFAILLNIYLIPVFGIFGASTAYVSLFGIMSIILLVIIFRYLYGELKVKEINVKNNL